LTILSLANVSEWTCFNGHRCKSLLQFWTPEV
jgi:hypothetical protein